jgi:hypothetical protein
MFNWKQDDNGDYRLGKISIVPMVSVSAKYNLIKDQGFLYLHVAVFKISIKIKGAVGKNGVLREIERKIALLKDALD